MHQEIEMLQEKIAKLEEILEKKQNNLAAAQISMTPLIGNSILKKSLNENDNFCLDNEQRK